MNFELTDDQQAIQRTAREFLAARYRPEEVRRLAEADGDQRRAADEHWQAIAELGWSGLVVPEEHGGLGLGAIELTVLQEQLGYVLAPTPFLSTVAAGALIAAAGSDEQKAQWLPRIAAGEARGTVAIWDADAGWSPDHSSLSAHGATLSGQKIAVPDALAADVLVVAGAQGRHWLVDPRDEGVRLEPEPSLDTTRPLFAVHLDGAGAHALPGDGQAVATAYHLIATATAAESVGLAQRAMEMAVQYAKDRRQFGRPIGTNQAVSHACAQMLLEVEGARSATLYAGWALDHEPRTGPLAASMAKAYASDAGWRVCASALQVHGGIGFTWEHDLHFLLKRAEANRRAWGDPRWHRARVAEHAGV